MADRKISDLTALTTPASGDYLPIVDISEAAAASKNKRITIQSLFQGIPVNVGIGTASPAAALHAVSASAGANSARFSDGVNSTLLIGHAATNLAYLDAFSNLGFYISGTERARIDSSGNVGIGTINSVGKLTVATSSADPSAALSSWSDGYLVIAPGGTTASGGVGLSFNTSSNVGGISCATPGSAWRDLIYKASAHRFELGGSEAARIDSSGRLLVGTSTSVGVGAKLQTVDDSNANPLELIASPNNEQGPNFNTSKARGSSASPTVVSSGDILGRWRFRGYDGSAYQLGAEITAQVDGTPGANDMPGRLVFSVTADGAAAPTERMRIAAGNTIDFFSGAATFTPEAITLTGAGASEEYVVTKSGVDTFRFGVDSGGPRITSGGVTRVIAGGSGGVSLAAGATSWAAISDERHKTNLQPITDGLDKVDTLRAVTGRYKTDNEDVSRSFLIAQDVQAVLPEAVDNSNEEQLSLRYSEIIPLLVAALKESKERIEQLEVAVTALQQS